MNTTDFRRSSQFLAHSRLNVQFIVLLGDNFYPNGVSSISDPLWDLFDELAPSAPEFYAVLGNHDYQQSVTPQLLYHTVSNKWNLPAQYYYRHIKFGGVRICALFLDTFEYNAEQLEWTIKTLSAPACADQSTYRLVFTHYPIRTVGVFHTSRDTRHLDRVLRPVLEEYHVHAYVAGHEHDMQLFETNGVTYMIAGSFSDKSEVAIHRRGAEQPVWQKVNTSGVIQFSIRKKDTSLRYNFISTAINQGEILYTGFIRLEGEWAVEPASPKDARLVSYYVILFIAITIPTHI